MTRPFGMPLNDGPKTSSSTQRRFRKSWWVLGPDPMLEFVMPLLPLTVGIWQKAVSFLA